MVRTIVVHNMLLNTDYHHHNMLLNTDYHHHNMLLNTDYHHLNMLLNTDYHHHNMLLNTDYHHDDYNIEPLYKAVRTAKDLTSDDKEQLPSRDNVIIYNMLEVI